MAVVVKVEGWMLLLRLQQLKPLVNLAGRWMADFALDRTPLDQLKLSLTILLSLSVLSAHGAQFRENFFKKRTVCNNAYGTTIGQFPNVQGFLTCAHECSNSSPCESLMYDPGTKLCTLNSQPWFTPITTGCPGNTVFYAEKFCVLFNGGPIQKCNPQMLTCTSDSGCTSSVNNIRLCDGGGAGVCNVTQGRLEVNYTNIWGTVCDDLSTASQLTIANVVCSMLGYTHGEALLSAPYGPGVDPIWMDDVMCVGNETTLFDCPHLDWGVHNCGHHEDLGIICLG